MLLRRNAIFDDKCQHATSLTGSALCDKCRDAIMRRSGVEPRVSERRIFFGVLAGTSHLAVSSMATIVAQPLIGTSSRSAVPIKLFCLLNCRAVSLGLAHRVVITNFTRLCCERNRDKHHDS
jgi:hypothetical protein